MNIKLDENLPVLLTRILSDLGHNVDTVPQEGLAGLDDQTVWHAAQQSGRFFITQDLDFSDIRRYAPGAITGCFFCACVIQADARSFIEPRQYLQWMTRNNGVAVSSL